MFIVRGDGRAVYEVYMLTVTCYAVGVMVSRCAECIPHVISLAGFFLSLFVSVFFHQW